MMQQNPCGGTGQCEHAKALISQATEGLPTVADMAQAQAQLAHCPPCASSLQLEVRFKMAMAAQCREQAPQSLQLKISENLKRIDLSQIDVTDL